jgi:hypothetical protein
LVDTGERTHVEPERAGRRVRVEHARVLLEGEPPRRAGWRLAARLCHLPGGTVVEPVPGAEVDEACWRGAEPRCEHCGLRRRRVETYLLEHRSGRLAQVGTSCLRDFSGHDPGRALLEAGYLAEAAALGTTAAAGRQPAEQPIAAAEYLAHVAALARERGLTLVSQAHAERPATAELAADDLRASRRGEAAVRVQRRDRERARAALGWVRGATGVERRWDSARAERPMMSGVGMAGAAVVGGSAVLARS